MEKIYKYRVIREDWKGNRGKRAKTYQSFRDNLKVGGLRRLCKVVNATPEQVAGMFLEGVK